MTPGEHADVEVLLRALREIQQAESGIWGHVAHEALTEWYRRGHAHPSSSIEDTHRADVRERFRAEVTDG